MEADLPWPDILLQNIKEEYQKPKPHIIITEANDQDHAYISKVMNEPNSFDSSDFMKEAANYRLRKLISGNHTILSYTNTYNDNAEWFRIMRCLSGTRPTRILFFGSEANRQLPEKNTPVKPININGGYTMRCDTGAIVIYRKEDAERVLIHELLHGVCSDPELPIAELEADTEAWAEIILMAFKARGEKSKWKHLMKKQVEYSFNQAKYVEKHHGVNNPNDYGWRYINGRLDVWNVLGIRIRKTKTLKKPRTLKLTID
jgi:hypothetical protein